MSDLKAGLIGLSGIGAMLAIANIPIGAVTFPVWGTVGVGVVAVGSIAGVTIKNMRKK